MVVARRGKRGVGKKVWVVLAAGMLLAMLTLPVFAATDKFIIWLNENKTLSGKRITFIGFADEGANFIVDGEYGTVLLNEERLVNGMYVTLTGKSSYPPAVIVNVTVNVNCGNGVCEEGEDHQICCKDCGCLVPGKGCADNVCIENISDPRSTYECLADGDCPSAACKVAFCNKNIIPYKCVQTPVTTCASGDGCCPGECSIEQDADCSEVDKCSENRDCDDQNPCTDDACSGDPKQCSYNAKVGCVWNGECLAIGAVKGEVFCSRASVMHFRKVNEELCEYDYECLSGACFTGRCKENRVTTAFFYIFFVFLGVMVIVVVSYIAAVISRAERKKKPLEEKKS